VRARYFLGGAGPPLPLLRQPKKTRLLFIEETTRCSRSRGQSGNGIKEWDV
jgi:hypothetical protein